jgi:hypothetical protein
MNLFSFHKTATVFDYTAMSGGDQAADKTPAMAIRFLRPRLSFIQPVK